MGLRCSPSVPPHLFLLFCPHLLLPTLFRRPGQLVAHSLHNHVGSVFILEQGLDLLQVTGEQGTVDCWVSVGAARPTESGPGTWGAPLVPCTGLPTPATLTAGGEGAAWRRERERSLLHWKGPRGLASGSWAEPSDYHPCSEEPPCPLTGDPEQQLRL